MLRSAIKQVAGFFKRAQRSFLPQDQIRQVNRSKVNRAKVEYEHPCALPAGMNAPQEGDVLSQASMFGQKDKTTAHSNAEHEFMVTIPILSSSPVLGCRAIASLYVWIASSKRPAMAASLPLSLSCRERFTVSGTGTPQRSVRAWRRKGGNVNIFSVRV